jgi:NTE family protein
MKNIENLVFKGGGVLGIAYAGAIEVLEDKGIVQNIKRVAGTSAGSIIATLIAFKFDSKEIKKILQETNFKDFEDHWDPLRMATSYGIYKGDFLLNWAKKIIKKKTGSENTTFGELEQNGFLDLRIFATDLTSVSVKEFSGKETPEVIIAEAVRASMSIPLVFTAWNFTNNVPDDHLYVDGGVLHNYPITTFESLDETLGFFLKVEKETEPLKYNHMIKYMERLLTTIMQVQTLDFLAISDQVKASVFIDSLGISPTNFKLNDEEKENLFNEGKASTLKYIESK